MDNTQHDDGEVTALPPGVSEQEAQRIGQALSRCTVVVNSHSLAQRIKNGKLTSEEFADLTKLLELHGYDLAGVNFSVRVDTRQRDTLLVSQVPMLANRHVRRIAAKMERKDARRKPKR